jgi:hypothetical protein
MIPHVIDAYSAGQGSGSYKGESMNLTDAQKIQHFI